MPRLRKYRRFVAACTNEPWAILPEKLREIAELIELRSAGVVLTDDQVRERVGAMDRPHLVQSASRVAVLNLYGTITQRANAFQRFSGGTSTEQFGRAFDEAIADEGVSAIVLNIDSPGGRTSGVEELAAHIHAARGSKPIVAVANGSMASAAYWIGSAADEIVAAPSAGAIGSIGVLTIHTDDSRARTDAGIDDTIIGVPEFKGELWQSLTESAKAFLQDRVESIYAKFLAAVAEHRGVSTEQAHERFGKGRAFLAEQALERGLVDRIGTLDSVLAEFGAGPLHDDSDDDLDGFDSITSTVPTDQPPRDTRTTAPPTKGETMNPKILTALVRRGLVDVGCTEAEYKAALVVAFEGQTMPDSDEAILAALRKPEPVLAGTVVVDEPTDTTSNGTGSDGLDMADVRAMVNLASDLSAETKLELLGDFAENASKLTHKDVLARLDKARTEAGGNQPTGTSNPDRITHTTSEVDKFTTSARNAILDRTWNGDLPERIFDRSRNDYVDFKPTRGEYGLQSLLGVARQCLILSGLPAGRVLNLAPIQAAQLVMGGRPRDLGLGEFAFEGYNVSGMFSNILLDASNVTLRRSYDDTRVTFNQWMRRGPDSPNFKDIHRVVAGEIGDPKAVPENGEIQETTLSDAKEKYRLTVWASIFSMSWHLVIDDQSGLDSFMEVPVKMGRAMRRKQNRLAYQPLKDNPTLTEKNAQLFNGTALASGGHNNLTTGAISGSSGYVAAWNTMTRKMSEQKGLDDASSTLNLMPRHVIYPPAQRGIIRQTLGSPSVAINTEGNEQTINIWQQGLNPIEEAELGSTTPGGSDVAHYLAADSGDIDTIEYAYLQGLENPVVEQENAFERLAIRRRIYHAFGVHAMDFRGLQKHTGE